MTELAENDDRSEGKIGKDSWIDGVSSGNIDAATPRADREFERPLFDGNRMAGPRRREIGWIHLKQTAHNHQEDQNGNWGKCRYIE